MSLKKLLDQLDGRNIAKGLTEEKLTCLGKEVKRRFNEDIGSMTDWSNLIDKGLELLKQDFMPKSEPFDGASNYKSPVIPEGIIKFGDRAKIELLNKRDLVKADIIGRDQEKKKEKQSDRVCEYMNYQLNHEMKEWRGDQEILFYRIGLIGNLFKKTQFDPFKGRNVSKVIHYPNFAVNQSTTNIDECRSFTDILVFDRNDVFERQNSKTWLDVEIYPELDEDTQKGDEGSSEANNVDQPEQNDDRFLEQHCYEDLDGDGYAEPYVITVHENTGKVVRIDACYSEDSIRVSYNDRIQTVFEAITDQAKTFTTETDQGLQSSLNEGFKPDFSVMTLVSIQQESQITSYPYYPSIDGTFLGNGYFHMIANLARANNITTNLLLDAAQLANLGGGFLAKGFRKKMGPMRIKPAQWNATEVPARDLAAGMAPNPTKEPSPALMSLNDKLEAQLRNFALVASDEGSGIKANTAPTTALAMIYEQDLPMSALLIRLTDSEAEEFKKLFRLNQRYIQADDYKLVLDEQEADYLEDFNSKLMDISPVANPEMSGQMKKVQMAEAQLAVFDRVVQVGGNAIPIIKNYFELIGSDLLPELFPEEGAVPKEDEKQMQAMAQQQQKAQQLQEVQIKLQEAQIQLMQQQVENEGLEAQSLAIKRKAEIQVILTKVDKTIAETLLIAEKAESEQAKNQISIYTTKLKSIRDLIDESSNSVVIPEPKRIAPIPPPDTSSALENI